MSQGVDSTAQTPAPPAPRFIETLPSIPPGFSALLSEYSKIPVAEQHQHIQTLRNAAYERHRYPCLGRFRFLDLDLSNHPLYATELLPRLTAPSRYAYSPEAKGPATQDGRAAEQPLFLDLGCCIGQDLRKLALDGVPVARLHGADLVPDFLDIGYALFRDAAAFPRSQFFAPADVLADGALEDGALAPLRGRVTALHVSAVFHLFDRQGQRLLARRCVELLDRRVGRCLVLGADGARVEAGERVRLDGGGSAFANNGDSWRELWEQVAADLGVRVEVTHTMRAGHPSFERGVSAEEKSKGAGGGLAGFHWSTWSVWVDFGDE